MFHQILNPAGNLVLTWLVALVPVIVLLVLLAVFRMSAWLATLLGSLITFLLAAWVWRMPFGDGVKAYLYGSATGIWAVDWITVWGVILFNTLVVTGVFEKFRRWLVAQGTADVRVQTMLFAWAFGAPILISLGIPDLDAIRVAAIANNAPVSYGALGAPIIALAAVTGLPLLALSGSVSKIVAILALAPPWVLLYLVSGKQGMIKGWPLAVVGSIGYIIGQLPVGVYIGPNLPDVAGSITCFVCLLILLQFWRPAQVLGYGGTPLPAGTRSDAEHHGLTGGEIFQACLPIIILVVVVGFWTGWFKLQDISWLKVSVAAASSIKPEGAAAAPTITALFNFNPFVGGTAILASWILVALVLRPTGAQLAEIFKKTWDQMWGAMLVGVFIFGLAYVFNYSGMAGSLAKAFSEIGVWFIVVAPILGFIGVALSGSNTSTNAMFGKFQALVGQLLGFPPLLLPTLNSVGAEIGKPIAPQTASVGVSTSKFVRNEGEVIRHNFGWTLVLLIYLVLIGVACYLFFPGIAKL